MDKRVLFLAGLSLAALAPEPAAAQAEFWQRKWFWGAQGGVFAHFVPTDSSRKLALTAGGHWLITGKRSALLIGFDHVMFPDSSVSLVADPIVPSGLRPVDFTRGRRIQALVYAIPTDAVIQPMLGGGFAIQQITDATPRGPFATLAEQTNAETLVANQDTRAFAIMSLGFQMRVMRRWAIYANYQFVPGGKDFLLTGEQHSLTAGIRYALTTSHEDVTTQR